mmetsp:Transcript_2273/g.2577  ORF Transcript_2273/g.2577 Transcript_2273/m.2577 type:complete len:157 (-) Transcript_2273:842-1312(-)
MNSAFTAIRSASVNKAAVLSHKQEVTRLYRNSLKLLFSWAVNRDVFIDEATKLRARFEANKNLGASAATTALASGKEEFDEHYHPDSYVVAYMPGGTKFMRNPPPPLEAVYPDGNYPADATTGTNTPVWPDSVPITFRPVEEVTGYVVDYSKKNME